MGLDVSVYLIVGISLKALGEIVEETETVQLVTSLGKPTGKSFDIRRLYLKTSKKRFLIATNENSIDRYGGSYMDYDFHSMFNDNKEYDNWVHKGENEIDGTVIGLSVKNVAQYPEEYSRYKQFWSSTSEQVQSKVSEISKALKERFGYEGQVYVFAFASYSY